jgi:hypothetical protein
MKRLLNALENRIRGWTALILALLAAGILVWWIGDGLAWRRWPDVLGIIRSSWLYLLIAGAICMSAAQSVVRRESGLSGAVTCLVIGLFWDRFQKLLFFVPIPFDIRWVLITYGLAGVAATCLRRAGVRQLLRKREIIEVPRPPSSPANS